MQSHCRWLDDAVLRRLSLVESQLGQRGFPDHEVVPWLEELNHDRDSDAVTTWCSRGGELEREMSLPL